MNTTYYFLNQSKLLFLLSSESNIFQQEKKSLNRKQSIGNSLTSTQPTFLPANDECPETHILSFTLDVNIS